jgi:hypothetical protein
MMQALAAPSPGALVSPEVIFGFLAEFLETHGGKPDTELQQTIRATCEGGFGWWIDPKICGLHRPATHMVEIALYGVSGFGMTPIEATRSWRRAAAHLVAA